MSQNDVVKLGIDLCRALEYCQQSKIVHRHIKPKNILCLWQSEEKEPENRNAGRGTDMRKMAPGI